MNVRYANTCSQVEYGYTEANLRNKMYHTTPPVGEYGIYYQHVFLFAGMHAHYDWIHDTRSLMAATHHQQ